MKMQFFVHVASFCAKILYKKRVSVRGLATRKPKPRIIIWPIGNWLACLVIWLADRVISLADLPSWLVDLVIWLADLVI